MKSGQEGSVLAAAIILSAILSIGGVGFLLVSAMWDTHYGITSEHARLKYAAESALLMGVRRLRTEAGPDEAAVDAFWANSNGTDTIPISPNYPQFIDMDGAIVKVGYLATTPSTPKRVIAIAALGEDSDLAIATWKIDAVRDVEGPLPIFTLDSMTMRIQRRSPD